MTEEKRIILNGENHIVVISDEPEALLAAKAAGRAAVAVDTSMHGGWIPGVSYVIPDFSYASDELAELVLRRQGHQRRRRVAQQADGGGDSALPQGHAFADAGHPQHVRPVF